MCWTFFNGDLIIFNEDVFVRFLENNCKEILRHIRKKEMFNEEACCMSYGHVIQINDEIVGNQDGHLSHIYDVIKYLPKTNTQINLTERILQAEKNTTDTTTEFLEVQKAYFKFFKLDTHGIDLDE